MTCIVGLEHEGKVYIGGDSAGTAGHIQRQRADEKVFTTDDFAFGFCGSYRTGQLLRHVLDPPPFDPRTDPDRYLAGPFVDSVRAALKRGGALRQEDNVDRLDGPFIVGWRGRLYEIESDFQVARGVEPFATTGSGWQLALAALAANDVKSPPRDRVTRALEIAAKYDAYVAAPFVVVEAPEIKDGPA